MKKLDTFKIVGIAAGIASTIEMIYIFALLTFNKSVTIYQDAFNINFYELIAAVLIALPALIVVLSDHIHKEDENGLSSSR